MKNTKYFIAIICALILGASIVWGCYRIAKAIDDLPHITHSYISLPESLHNQIWRHG